MQISPLGCRLVSALSIPVGEWHKSPADFNPNHNHYNADQNKQASRPLHVHTTKQTPSKILYVQCTRLITNLWTKKINKKSGIGHQYLK